MGRCECCGEYTQTSEARLGDSRTGRYVSMQLCRDCTLAGAAMVAAGGGKVHLVDGHKTADDTAGWWVVPLVVVGLLIWWAVKHFGGG